MPRSSSVYHRGLNYSMMYQPTHAMRPRAHPFGQRSPAVRRVRDVLRSAIMTGELGHDTPLPSEQALIDLYGTSRGVIRDALGLLRDEGLIQRLQGAGTFVVSPPLTGRNIDMLNMHLEPNDRARVYRATVTSEQVSAPPLVADRLGLEPGEPVVYHERLNYLDGLPFNLRTGWMPMRVGSRLLDEQADPMSLVVDVIEGVLGFTVDRAELMVGACCADGATAPVLDVPVGAPLVLIERLLVDAEGRGLEMSFSRIRGDRLFLRTIQRREPEADLAGD